MFKLQDRIPPVRTPAQKDDTGSHKLKERERERGAQPLAAPKGYVRLTHTYGLQRVGLAALINIRFLKYLPHPLARPRPRPALSATRLQQPPPTERFLESSILHLYF